MTVNETKNLGVLYSLLCGLTQKLLRSQKKRYEMNESWYREPEPFPSDTVALMEKIV